MLHKKKLSIDKYGLLKIFLKVQNKSMGSELKDFESSWKEVDSAINLLRW